MSFVLNMQARLDASDIAAGAQKTKQALAGIASEARSTEASLRAALDAQFGIGGNGIGRDRAADVAAYGKQLDDLRARYNPLYAAQRAYLDRLAEIRRAHKVGALSADEMNAAIGRTKASFASMVVAMKETAPAARAAAAAMAVSGTQGMLATRLAAHEITNLSYQMNDVATMLISGQSPFIIMAQQGLQVSQIMGRRGLGQILPALGAGLTSLLTPTTLLLAGVTAAGYGVAALFGAMNDDGAAAEKVLADHVKLIRDVTNEWGDAVPALKAYLDELERAGKLSDLRQAGAGAIEAIWQPARDQIAAISRDVDQLLDGLDLVGRSEAATTLAETWNSLASKIDAGTATARDARQVQEALNAVMDDGGAIASDLAGSMTDLAASLDAVSNRSARIASDIAKAQNPLQQFHEAETQSRIAYEKALGLGQEFIADLERRNGLTREQLALETEIDRIKKDAARSGALVSDADARRLAAASIAADGRRGQKKRSDPVGDLIASQNDALAKLRQEAGLIGASAVERAKANALLEAEIEIRKLGIDVNGQYAETIRRNAEETANWTAENERLAAGFETARSAGESMIDTVLDKLRGGDLTGLLQSLGDQLLNLASMLAVANPLKNALYGENLATLSSVGGGGGLFSMLFGGGGSSDPWAGLRTAGGSSGGGWLGSLLSIFGFDTGGWTGDGNPRDVAGYAHREEFVVRAGPAKRFRPMLEAINRGGDPGHFEGGMVGQSYSGGSPASGAGGRGAGRGAGNVYVKIEDHAGVSVGQRSETNSDGDQMLTFVLDKVGGAIADGQFDNSFRRYNGGQVRGTRR